MRWGAGTVAVEEVGTARGSQVAAPIRTAQGTQAAAVVVAMSWDRLDCQPFSSCHPNRRVPSHQQSRDCRRKPRHSRQCLQSPELPIRDCHREHRQLEGMAKWELQRPLASRSEVRNNCQLCA
jgi:hypothetical protein